MSFSEELEKDGEFVLLQDNDAYKGYFAALIRAFEYLLSWYHQTEGADDEEKIIGKFLARMLYTIQLLAMKSISAPQPMLRLDLNESGYPHLLAINEIETDLRRRDELLRSLDSPEMLKQAMLTHMLSQKAEPTDLLASLAFRRYADLLDETKVLLQFTPGELILKSETDEKRHYIFSWACYDVATNIPHVHIMLFEQDKTDEPLEKEGMSRSRFMDVVRAEGRRVPPLSVLANSIDESIESIHPKMIKRVKLGPVLSTAFSREEHPLIGYLKEFAGPEDFIFLIRDEMVFSRAQVERKKGLGIFSSEKLLREIFAVRREDIECMEAGASSITRKMLLPHHLLQHLNAGDEVVARYDQKITYTTKGDLNAV